MRVSWVKLSLIILLFGSLVIRLYQIDAFSNQFHIDRQYYTAQMVRGQYFDSLTSIPEWRREIAQLNQPPPLEPPVIQSVALIGDSLTGAETLAIPRAFSALMWVIGGLFMYLAAKIIMREEAALVAAAFYLLAAFGISASRSFQANPTMIAFCVISWYTILHYFEQPSKRRLIAAIAAAAIANLVMIYAVFIILPLFAWLAIQRYGFRRALLNRSAWAFAFFSLLPSGLYYFLGFFVLRFLNSQTGALFNPHLWFSADYWIDWMGRIGVVIGFVPVILSIQALVATRKPLPAAVLRSLWLGYFIYGFLVNWPISSHDYYSLPTIPIAALSLGCVIDFVVSAMRKPSARRWIPAVTLIAIAVITYDGLYHYLPSTTVTPEEIQAVQDAKDIGTQLNHSPDVIFLTENYGSLLKFYGEIAGVSWPDKWDNYANFVAGRPQPTADALLQNLLGGHPYHYFVITAFDEYDLQPDLKHDLDTHYLLMTRTDDYAIYDLQSAAHSSAAASVHLNQAD